MFLRWDGHTASQLPFLYPHCHLSHTLRKRNVMKITCKHIPPAQEVQRFFQVYFKNQEEFSYFPPPSPEHSSEHHRAAYSLEKTKPLSKEQQERAQTHWPQGAVPTCGPWRMSPQVQEELAVVNAGTQQPLADHCDWEKCLTRARGPRKLKAGQPQIGEGRWWSS